MKWKRKYHTSLSKWEEEKTKTNAEGEEISIEGFTKFYTNLINIEEKAQYIRKQARPSESTHTKPVPRNVNLYHATIKPGQNNQNQTRYGDRERNSHSSQQSRKENFQGKIKGNFRGQIDGANSSNRGEPSTPRYCMFCETNTHGTGLCKIAMYTADFKTQ